MDWPKAKTILILGFLLLDLYLAYLLFLVPGAQALPTSLDSIGLRKLGELTSHYNYSLLATPKPLKTGRLPVLQVTIEPPGQDEVEALVLNWLGQLVEGESLANGSTAYTLDERFLYLGNNGSLRYEDRSPVPESTIMDRIQVEGLIFTFLEPRIGSDMAKIYQVSLVTQLPDGAWLVELTRSMFGTPLFADKVRAVVANEQVQSVETLIGVRPKASWLAPRGTIVTADRAVLRFLAQQAKPREHTAEIIDVRLGYDFANADQQELIPVWRIVTDQGSEEYTVPAGVRYWRSGGP